MLISVQKILNTHVSPQWEYFFFFLFWQIRKINRIFAEKKMGEFDLDSGCKFSLDGGSKSKSKSKTNTEQQEPERLANKRRVTMCEIHTDRYLFRRAFSEVQFYFDWFGKIKTIKEYE